MISYKAKLTRRGKCLRNQGKDKIVKEEKCKAIGQSTIKSRIMKNDLKSNKINKWLEKVWLEFNKRNIKHNKKRRNFRKVITETLLLRNNRLWNR